MKKIITIIFLSVFFLSSCSNKESKATAPWGETMNDTVSKSKSFTMSDIVNNGELIMLTMNGPDNYYEYHGAGFGTQYLLCEKFAQKLGVSLRVEVCRDTAELVRRLNNGDGDIIAFQLPKNIKGRGSLVYCGARIDSLHTQWAVKKGNMELADTLNKWFRPEMVAQINKEETYLLSSGSVRRHVYSPMLSSKGGIIS
ncbi:MAG: tail length tape measure protein, partial [Prevotella sp.]|nr:tail length tape measure protein [Prevotella sp.]